MIGLSVTSNGIKMQPSAQINSRYWSSAYEAMICRIMVGDLVPLIDELPLEKDLTIAERLELESTIEFQLGKLRPAQIAALWQRVFWVIWIKVPGGHFLLRMLLWIFFALCHFAGSRRVFDALRVKLAPAVVHHRYNNFLTGLCYAAILKCAADKAHHFPESAYYQTLIGLFECLSGRFDLGLKNHQAGYQSIAVLHESANGLNVTSEALLERYLTIGTLRSLYLSYSGNHDEAYRGYRTVTKTASQTHRYAFIEIFLHSMKMFSDVETLNAVSLAESTMALKELIGTYFKGLFALRASVYSSLIAAIQGKTQFAGHQLALSEKFYSESLPAIEVGRYHFLRAMIHLELNDLQAASNHAAKSRAFVSEVQGAQFHAADALLLHLELRLRIRLREGGKAYSDAEILEIKAQIRRIRNVVRGCPLQATKCRALLTMLRFIQGDFFGVRQALPQLRDECQRFSLRFGHVLREIDVRSAGNVLAAPSPDESRARRTASIMEQFQKLLTDKNPKLAAAELFTTIVGGSLTGIAEEPRGVKTSIFSHRIDANNSERLIIALPGPESTRVFTVYNPLIDVSVDHQSMELLELACTLVVFAEKKHSLDMAERNAAIVKTTQMLAHDIRKPFSQLQTLVDYIQSSQDANTLVHWASVAATEIKASMHQVHAMLADLMEIDALSAIVKEPVSVQSIVQEAAAKFKSKAIIDCQHSLVVYGDSARLMRVMTNIIENAVHAGCRMVKISSKDINSALENDRGEIEVTVANDGKPIPVDVLDEIFTPFFSCGKRGGTGLGLAIVHKIITAHGGTIKCNSSAEATEFVIRLPAMLAGNDSRCVENVIGDTQRPEVLIVDDDVFILEAWQSKLGHSRNVATYSSPESLLRSLSQEAQQFSLVRCIITDMNFAPGEISGLELARVLREKINAPILMASDAALHHNGEVDAVIGKAPVGWLDLQRYVTRS